MDVKKKVIKYSMMCSKYDDSRESTVRHNYAMRSLQKLLHKINDEKIDTAFYLELLRHEDDRVRLTAAAHCLDLGVFVDEAKNELIKLSKTAQTPLLQFSAEITLEQFQNKGHLNL